MSRTMTAAEYAIQAAQAAEAKRVEDMRAERQRKADEAQARVDAKLAAALPILSDWFPGVRWDILDDGEKPYYSALVLTPEDGDDRLKIKVERWRTNMDEPDADPVWRLELSVVEQNHRDGYSHWDPLPGGEKVKSLEDVGRALTRPPATCSCDTNHPDPSYHERDCPVNFTAAGK